MTRLIKGFLMVIFIWGLSSCTSIATQNTIASTSIETPLPSSTPTPTIVWFPATATVTPLSHSSGQPPSIVSNEDHGPLLFRDDFTDPEAWGLGKMPAGIVQLGLDEISIGIEKPNSYLFSLRKGSMPDDFYLEINANPSLCRGKDEYGLLLRVSANLDYIRFGINCAGEARVDRLLSGQASSLQPPKVSGAIPPGGPSQSQLSVRAEGRDIRFFVNGEFLFAIRDPSLLSGGIGVYVRSAGQEVVTVNFSRLLVYEI